VSRNSGLWSLNCAYNRLTALDVTKNTELLGFSCAGNRITTLDVSKNRKLEVLWAFINQIETIDIKNCTALQEALKLEKKVDKDQIMWGTEEEWGFNPHLYIDKGTSLTAGKKVLYKDA